MLHEARGRGAAGNLLQSQRRPAPLATSGDGSLLNRNNLRRLFLASFQLIEDHTQLDVTSQGLPVSFGGFDPLERKPGRIDVDVAVGFADGIHQGDPGFTTPNAESALRVYRTNREVPETELVGLIPPVLPATALSNLVGPRAKLGKTFAELRLDQIE